MDTAPTDPNPSPSNPLLNKQLKLITKWEDWLEQWKNASSVPECLGLLHVGHKYVRWIDQRRTNELDIFLFYLNIADLRGISTSDQREVADKAFKVLCDTYFKKRYGFSEISEIASETLIERIVDFFSYRGKFDTNTRRFSLGDHSQEVVDSFVESFVEALWKYSSRYFGWENAQRARWSKLRIQTLPILIELGRGKVDMLLESSFPDVDSESLQALEALALRHPDGGTFKSIEEAFVKRNSDVVRVTILLKTWEKELARQNEVEAIERERRILELRLKKLD